MEKISVKSTSEEFKGRTIENDLKRYGYIYVNFYIHSNFVGVEVAGFSQVSKYVYNPKNQKDIKLNNYFVDRYVNNCENSEEIKKQLCIS